MNETSTPTSPGAPYGAPGDSGQPKPPGGAAFFDWVRSLGFVRGPDRWLAGVCGAIATRTGLDPLIVRGIAVVITILGGPIFFLYALGWAFLPDESGRSLVEKAARQIFEPAMIAVGALVLLSFVPWMQGIWWQGPPEVWGMPGWLEVLLRTSWAIGLTVAIILLVIYIAKRVPSPRNPPYQPPYQPNQAPHQPAYSAGGPSAAPSASAAPSTPAAAYPSAATATPTAAYPSAATATPTAAFVPPVPPVPEPRTAPPADSTTGAPASSPAPGPSLWDDLTGNASPAPSAPDRSVPYGSGSTGYGSTGYGSTGSGSTVPSLHDHYRTLQRRRQLGAGFISVVVGLALSAGAVAAYVVADGTWSTSALLVGMAAALGVIALGIVVAGIRGKEGGWLNFFSIALAISLACTAFIPVGTDVLTFGDPTWEYISSDPEGFAMIAGSPRIDLTGLDDTPASTDRTIDVWLAFGDVELLLPENRTVEVQVGNIAGGIDYGSAGGSGIERGGLFYSDTRTVVNGSGSGVTTVRVWNGFGETTINQPVLPALR
jgi:phage shock protein PspC (stress-responsive transcriptional regulator)